MRGTIRPASFYMKDLEKYVARANVVSPLAARITDARDWRDRLDAISSYYARVDKEIHAAPHDEWAFDVYEVDWPMLFTPIEAAMWSDIRGLGIVLYPQYPIGPYFADFANPRCKVAIECDGKAFHTNRDRDRDRDAQMQRLGWRVFRFSGADCRQDFNSETMQRSLVSRQLMDIAAEYMREPWAAAAARKNLNTFE